MDALLMCGGRGTRLADAVDREKPLVRVDGEPMVDRVRGALGDSRIETVYAVVSPNAPDTRDHLAAADVPVVETPGEGYVADLDAALDDDRVSPPVCTVAADLPLLEAPVVDRVRERCAARDGRPSATVAVPVALKRRLGATVDARLPEPLDHLAPTGLNVVGADDESPPLRLRTYDHRVAINVNRPADLRIAEAYRDGS